MTLILPARVPALMAWALLAIGVDLIVSLMLSHGEQGAGVLMLFQLAGFLGWMGGLEALSWMSQDSPWARARQPQSLDELRQALHHQLEPQPRGYLQKRMATLKRWDLAGWRAYSLRLMSGASLVFLGATTFLFLVSSHLPDNLRFLGWWSLLVFIRLVPIGCAATFLAPVMLVALPKRRPTAGEIFHAGLAAGAAGLALFQVWLLNQPPVGDFLMMVLHAGFDIWGWPYGVMIGGFFWFIVAGRRSE